MNILIGGQSYLATQIKAHLTHDNVFAPQRRVYANWWQEGAADSIAHYFTTLQQSGTRPIQKIFITAGILDPQRSPEEHQRINYQLVKNIILGAAKLNLRTISFGTIMEEFAGQTNAYVTSKHMLSAFIEENRAQHACIHIRLHTLYGGNALPHPFMFLGQMFRAVATRSPFNMSLGTQLREYHHIEDVVHAIMLLAASNHSGVINLNHGEPLPLKCIAQHVFKQFNCEKLLCMGTIPQPAQENYKYHFAKTDLIKHIRFRDTLSGITEYLKNCMLLNKVAI